jgi:L-methionine (R)-S-oxide reductase
MQEIEVTTASSKQEQYTSLLPQIEALCSGEADLIANLSNIASALKQQFNWWWVGFYLVKENELVLGPFQGPVACTRIAFGKGVCGTSWQKNETILVEDVSRFPGHIACSHASKSEIVIPIHKHDNVVAVLDVDSEYLSHFNSTDQQYLEQLAQFIATLF